jgi:hypothetical protein
MSEILSIQYAIFGTPQANAKMDQHVDISILKMATYLWLLSRQVSQKRPADFG